MASSSKKKTTFAKMNRETAVREKRMRKQAKKDARKLAAAEGPDTSAEPAPAGDDQAALEPLTDTSASSEEVQAGA